MLASASLSSLAQSTKTVQGTVTDQNGEPLIGVTIKAGTAGPRWQIYHRSAKQHNYA
mgnify:CR=1 FL=1